jgi:hypothetical protein
MAKWIGFFDYVLGSTTISPGTKSKIGAATRFEAIRFGMPAIHFTLKHFDGKQVTKATVGSDLLSEAEIDRWVAFLKKDLDTVARRAKRAIRRAKTAA